MTTYRSPNALGPFTCLTSGASSGLGLAIAVSLARRGHRSYAGVRSAAGREQVLRAAEDAGVAVHPIWLDVTSPSDCKSACDEVSPDLLINNAAIPAAGALMDVDESDARQAIETMLLGPMRLVQLAVPGMGDRGLGRIVNISSIAAFVPLPLTGWYAANKHAIEALSKILRLELEPKGVEVMSLRIGGIKSGIWERAQADLDRRAAASFDSNLYRRVGPLWQIVRMSLSPCEKVAEEAVALATANRLPGEATIGVDARLLETLVAVVPKSVRSRLIKATFSLR